MLAQNIVQPVYCVYTNLRRLGGQQSTHLIFLKSLDMIYLEINYHYISALSKKSSGILFMNEKTYFYFKILLFMTELFILRRSI